MKHGRKKRNFLDLFVPHRVRALEYEHDRRLEKIRECMVLKDENEKLWDMAVKQRIALDALQKGHAQDMAEMTESLRKAHEKLAAAEAERDRYKDALRRAFPKGVSA